MKENVEAFDEIDNDLVLLKSGIAITEKIILDGNEELVLLVKKDSLDRQCLADAHQKISMDDKRKFDFQDSLTTAE